ncbi:tetratricopeptide repeat protein (macronuclear) [Tetrahymena thermophila SB210]|uniref:Tetratricopeptide repeat protein n=1 Tax=Tetrahymena thermophila (strain SB210) TaxID=312017 RepID=I7M1F5_TETTS|nr:tetratricopeptide repeat protein [Tetrahymena thermophila SB210]EAR96226.2 tetratricopeptide repeat protein [Tetrahymena thermophila SB210]|eukprot:XP_001016471.2 tetratricopeptide repeat protein [Tetrahymena thermophila SB210]
MWKFKQDLIVNIYGSLKDWEDLSIAYLKVSEMQLLHNSVYVNKLISQIHLQKISNDLIVQQGLYYKFYKPNDTRLYKNCSYHNLNHGLCPQYIYDAFSDNEYSFKVELFFHRTNFTYDSFQAANQIVLRQNWDFLFFAKSAIYSRRNDFINITLVYNSFNDSFMAVTPGKNTNFSSNQYLDCMGHNYTEPYDPRCRPWYQNSLLHPGNQFNKPYKDLFSHATIMTASARIDDPNGNNISIISIDFNIQNLIDNLFTQKEKDEIDNNFDTHSVLFHEDKNTVYYHRYWNFKERTIVPWQDLEFNKTDSNFTDDEYYNFVRLIQDSKDYSLTGQYDIKYKQNITPFYQFWSKNKKPQQFF